jgi:hypothetical protein
MLNLEWHPVEVGTSAALAFVYGFGGTLHGEGLAGASLSPPSLTALSDSTILLLSAFLGLKETGAI